VAVHLAHRVRVVTGCRAGTYAHIMPGVRRHIVPPMRAGRHARLNGQVLRRVIDVAAVDGLIHCLVMNHLVTVCVTGVSARTVARLRRSVVLVMAAPRVAAAR
jgi:hypothetical protein